jgi:cell division protein FtsI (penicillin-binding protein 3)/stage V sporulation protein D (sporulation-specific penicillin-binding protein)
MPTFSHAQFGRPLKAVLRARLWYVVVMLIFGVFLVRLFYLQIIRHDYYKHSATVGHLKEYEIAADRGVIKAHSGGGVVPIVLNQTLYTVYADPALVKDSGRIAETLAATFGGHPADYEGKIKSKDTRYVIIARKVTKDQKESILKHKYAGLGAQEQQYRTYPNGSLAAQVLGFVNDDSKGVYGVEQALDTELAGRAGQLKAVTDVNGVPLAANTDNILTDPVPGKDLVLTLDVAMQKQLEDILKKGLEQAQSDSGSALIIDPNTGAIKAMANWPTYDPANYAKVEDANIFTNPAVSAPLEIGSTMKPLTVAAALDSGSVPLNYSYYDPSRYVIDDFTVKNIEEDGGPGNKSIADILNLSLNTGATHMLMKMGGSSDHITKAGRERWHDYMTNHYRFGKTTGIEQGYEAEGVVPDPNKGYARDLTYANTAFGQAMTATPLQLGAAFSAMINGGTYYQPHLVDYEVDDQGKETAKKPKILAKNVVSSTVSDEMQPLLEYVVDHHSFSQKFDQKTYSVGGKTGTAQIADPNGGYFENEYNGTYVGFVGGNQPQYVIAVSVHKPKIPGYAGSRAAQPIFGDLAHMLLDKFNVTPKT